jgi:hypothetical protein
MRLHLRFVQRVFALKTTHFNAFLGACAVKLFTVVNGSNWSVAEEEGSIKIVGFAQGGLQNYVVSASLSTKHST